RRTEPLTCVACTDNPPALTWGQPGVLRRTQASRTIRRRIQQPSDRPTRRRSFAGARGDPMTEFDMGLVQRGARNRRTPYHEAEQRYSPLGYTVYNHMYFPIRYDSFENEFEALLNDVTVWDVSVERCLEITGPDGFTFAQLM